MAAVLQAPRRQSTGGRIGQRRSWAMFEPPFKSNFETSYEQKKREEAERLAAEREARRKEREAQKQAEAAAKAAEDQNKGESSSENKDAGEKDQPKDKSPPPHRRDLPGFFAPRTRTRLDSTRSHTSVQSDNNRAIGQHQKPKRKQRGRQSVGGNLNSNIRPSNVFGIPQQRWGDLQTINGVPAYTTIQQILPTIPAQQPKKERQPKQPKGRTSTGGNFFPKKILGVPVTVQYLDSEPAQSGQSKSRRRRKNRASTGQINAQSLPFALQQLRLV